MRKVWVDWPPVLLCEWRTVLLWRLLEHFSWWEQRGRWWYFLAVAYQDEHTGATSRLWHLYQPRGQALRVLQSGPIASLLFDVRRWQPVDRRQFVVAQKQPKFFDSYRCCLQGSKGRGSKRRHVAEWEEEQYRLATCEAQRPHEEDQRER